MRKIIYILTSVILFAGCGNFYGTLDDANAERLEIVAINTGSVPVSLTIHGAKWICPDDTINLKPHNGLWKKEEALESPYYRYSDVLDIHHAVVRVDFNDGERIICFDESSTLPYNPCGYDRVELWDDFMIHRVIEFNDQIRDTLFARQDRLSVFDIRMNFSPSQVIDSLYTTGSTEGYFTRLFPAGKVKDQLKIGSVVYSEADSINKIRFVENLRYEPDSLETKTETITRYHTREIYHYYDLKQLRKLGMTNFGCDFAALTEQKDDKMEKFCGVAFLKTQVGRSESILDKEHPAKILEALENMPETAYIVNMIEYGNFMLLLAEADCSHENLYRYVSSKLLDNDRYYYDDYHTPEISFRLITLDENGSFTCQSGGNELAEMFKNGYENASLYPLSFSVSNLKNDSAHIHITGTDGE